MSVTTNQCRVTSQESKDLIYVTADAWNHAHKQLPIRYSSFLYNVAVKRSEEGKDVARKSHFVSLHQQSFLFIIMCLYIFLPTTMEQSHFDIC
jgi:hypothetical protein